MDVFGFEIKRTGKADVPEQNKKSFVQDTKITDGATVLSGNTPGFVGGHSGAVADFNTKFQSEQDLIMRYREAAMQPEADKAIESIVDEAIITDTTSPPVSISLDETKNVSESIRKKVVDEFDTVLDLLSFNREASDIFSHWYIDGRINYHVIKDNNNPKNGILELRWICPTKISKVVEIEKETETVGDQHVDLIKSTKEYYIFTDEQLYSRGQAVKIHPDEIVQVHSGKTCPSGKTIYSHLHKALKPINQLRMIEDASVIFRLVRAPERRVFNIAVGNVPNTKAEQIVKNFMQKYRNKLTYDALSGSVSTQTHQQTMMEDFWFAKRDGQTGTEVTTLPSGQGLGEMDDVLYFQKKMYNALNVPSSRIEAENSFSIGRASEITRDEVKFAKFIGKLRRRFSMLFLELLKKQVLLKKIMTHMEWEQMENSILFDYTEDNHYAELKQSEILSERLGRLGDIEEYVGKYFSKEYIRKNVLMQTEENIIKIDQEIAQEQKASEIDDIEHDDSSDDADLSVPNDDNTDKESENPDENPENDK